MPDSDPEVHHYHHILTMHRKLQDHSWSRSQTRYDSVFIAWLDKQMMDIANEAYALTQGRKGG